MIFDITVTLEDATVTATATNDIAVTVTLDDEVINPEETFCERVDACLDIPTADGQYVLTITGNVISWEEFSASGLVDGNGTTVNGNKVDLGGDVIQDTILNFNPTVYKLVLGSEDEAVFFYGELNGGAGLYAEADNIRIASYTPDSSGELSSFTVDNSTGYSVTVLKNQTAGVGVDYGIAILDKTAFGGEGKSSNIYYGKNDGAGNTTDLIRIEVLGTDEETSHAHMRRFIDFDTPVNYNGVHVNKYYAQLEYNKQSEDDQDTGTLWVVNADGAIMYKDGVKVFRIKNSVPTYANDAAAITGGLTTGDVYKNTTGGITSLCIVP